MCCFPLNMIFINHYLSVSGTGHVDPVDLNDLVPGLKSPVTRHKTIREDLLDDDAPQRGVGPAHDGDSKAGAGPGDLHVGHLPLQYGEPGDACNGSGRDRALGFYH